MTKPQWIIGAIAAAVCAAVFLLAPKPHPLSPRELADLRENILKTQETKGTLAALEEFAAAMDRDKLGYDFCHPVAAELGENAGARAAAFSDAVRYPTHLMGYCTGGFIHGAAQAFLERSTHVVDDGARICDAFDARDSASFYSTCVHGVGHGFMAGLHNDLPKALAACERAFGGQKLSLVCTEGVFMQNFDAGHHDDSDASPYMKNDDLFYPCQVQPDRYKARCYNHAPEHFLDHHPADYSGLITFCGTAEADYRFACFRDAGRRIVQNHIGDPKEAEALAQEVPGAFVADYIYGMAIGYQEFFPEPGKGAELCRSILTRTDRGFCPADFR